MLFCNVTLPFLHQEGKLNSLPLEPGLASVTCSIKRLEQKLYSGASTARSQAVSEFLCGSPGKLTLGMFPLKAWLPHGERAKPHDYVWVLRSPASAELPANIHCQPHGCAMLDVQPSRNFRWQQPQLTPAFNHTREPKGELISWAQPMPRTLRD